MKTPAASPKKARSAPKTNLSAQTAAAKGARRSPRKAPATARANVRAPQGVAALTSAAMLAAMHPAMPTHSNGDSFTAQPELASPGGFALAGLLRQVMQWVRHSFSRMRARLPGHSPYGRTLQLLEMQSLGEKRFVAVLKVGNQRFLIGGATASVQLLGEIGETATTVIPPRPLRREKA